MKQEDADSIRKDVSCSTLLLILILASIWFVAYGLSKDIKESRPTSPPPAEVEKK